MKVFLLRSLGALPQLAIRWPRTVVALSLLVTLAAAPGMLRLKLRTDGHALVSGDDPAVIQDNAIRREFGIEDNIVVLIATAHTNGIYNSNTLQLVRDLTAAFKEVPGINPSNVVSLATEPTFRFRPGTLHFQTVLEVPSHTPQQLAQLREDLRNIRLYTGTVVAYDGRSTAILIGTPADADRPALYRALRAKVAACGARGDEVSIIGAPVAESLLGLHILEDLGLPRALLPASVSAPAASAKWPRTFYELRLWIARHIGLLPIAIGVMALVFYASFRRVAATLLPLMEVGACLVFVFGLMGWLGVPVYLTTAVMPVILTAMGVSDEIYIFKRFVELVRERPDAPHTEAVSRAMHELWRPIVNMAATTVIGFLSFALSSVKPVQMFGVFTAVGIAFCVLWSLMVIPAMLVLIRPAWLLPEGGAADAKPEESSPRWRKFAEWILRRRRAVLAALVVIAALTPLGIARVVVQDSWIDGFDPASEFRRATRLVNEQFHGAHLLQIRADAGHLRRGARIPWTSTNDFTFALPAEIAALDHETLRHGWLTFTGNPRTNPGPFGGPIPAPVWRSWIESVTNTAGKVWATTPRQEGSPRHWMMATSHEPIQIDFVPFAYARPGTLHRLAAFGEFIRRQRTNAVGGALGAADYVATTRFMVRPTETNAHRIPDTPQQVKTLWDNYRIARGPERLRQAVDTNFAISLTTVFLKDANFVGTARLMENMRAYEREQLSPHGIKLSFAGDVAVSQSLIERIVSTQVRSLSSSLLGIFLVVLLLGRSWRGGAYCVLPSLFAVTLNFAIMGWVGMPLGVATSMFAGMTLGMGVDFAIHLVERFQLARSAGADANQAVVSAVRSVGPAVLLNALGIALGFGILMLSQVPANARLGALVVLGVVNCLVATLLILPVLLRLWPPAQPKSPAEPVTAPSP